ncbi:MAG: hypothetical protein LQ341_005732 [Variospora aurantia]|nr:MAG: hypothetical protein LQ341_005732 [Variospora aurantia]
MPPQTVSFRPQTSRQAKRAYQKAGGAPRLSEMELRRLERSAELQDRAARIKAHNDRARENKRKRAEKMEARKRQGIAEPAKIKIGSSQLRLGAFVGAGIKKKREEASRSMPSADLVTDREASERAETTSEHLGSLPTLSPPGTPVACRSDVPPRGQIDAFVTAASLMPPPPPRPPLREASENTIPHAVLQADRCDLSGSIGIDWEQLFDSNTQVEREISGQRPSAPGVHKKIAVGTPPSSRLPSIDLSLLSNISTQDLQYSSSPPSTKEVVRHGDTNLTGASNEVNMEDSMDRIGAKCPILHDSYDLTAPLDKLGPTSSPNYDYDELTIIETALWERYCVRLPHLDIKRLLAGQYLNEGSLLCATIPPRLVTNIATNVTEMRQNGQRPPNPLEIMRWATRLEQMDHEREENITTKPELNKEEIAKDPPDEDPCTDSARGNPTDTRQSHTTLVTRAFAKREEQQESKSFDEFDVFDVSSQDLRDLNV